MQPLTRYFEEILCGVQFGRQHTFHSNGMRRYTNILLFTIWHELTHTSYLLSEKQDSLGGRIWVCISSPGTALRLSGFLMTSEGLVDDQQIIMSIKAF